MCGCRLLCTRAALLRGLCAAAAWAQACWGTEETAGEDEDDEVEEDRETLHRLCPTYAQVPTMAAPSAMWQLLLHRCASLPWRLIACHGRGYHLAQGGTFMAWPM